jgi:hypothetical protein
MPAWKYTPLDFILPDEEFSMKRIFVLSMLAAGLLATPSYGQSCDSLVRKMNSDATKPASTAFKMVMLVGPMYALGNVSREQLRQSCDLYDDFMSEMDDQFDTKQQYIENCNGTLKLGDGTVLRTTSALARNKDFILEQARKTHADICAIADGRKKMPGGIFGSGDDDDDKNSNSAPPPSPPPASSRRADIPPPSDSGGSSGRSYWAHNGSVLYLIANGRSRELYYDTPKPGLVTAGATPGSLLFKGTFQNGTYSGTAYIFNKRCGTVPYQVSGPVSNDFESVTMQGDAPSGLDANCNPTKYVADTLQFSLCSKTGSGSPACP